MRTDWHCRWLQPGTQAVYRTRFHCRLYTLEFGDHSLPLSTLLTQQQQPIVPGSSHDILRRQYERNCAQPSQGAPPIDEDVRDLGPIVEPPLIHSHAMYQLLALNGSELQRSVRATIDAQFDLDQLMLAFCLEYSVTLERTFPSLRHESANRPAPQRKPGSVIPRATDDDAYKFDEGVVDLNEVRYEPVHRPRPARTTEFDRLLPLCLLPLVLDRLPGYFQQVNNIGEQCTRLKDTLLLEHSLGLYPPYVHRQLQALRHNTHVLGFMGQQARLQLRQDDPVARERERHREELRELALVHETEVGLLRTQLDRMHENMSLFYDKWRTASGEYRRDDDDPGPEQED